MSLPFVPDGFIAKSGEDTMNFEEVCRIMGKENPHLLEYIYGFVKYIEAEGRFTNSNVMNFGLSIYELLRQVQANELRPRVVCLCGSTRFWRTFQQASLQETIAGRIVLSIGAASGTDDDHFGNLPREEYDRIKATLDELHLRKVEMADEILVLNVGGYIGESTARELAHARKLGKMVRFWEPEKYYFIREKRSGQVLSRSRTTGDDDFGRLEYLEVTQKEYESLEGFENE